MSNTTSSHGTRCSTSVAMHKATVQKPLTPVSLNSKPTIVMIQAEAGFVGKHKVVPLLCLCPLSLHHWRSKRLWFPIKGKQSNEHLAYIPLCSNRHRIVRVDTKLCVTV
ncbi:hypothetical protein TNCV_1876191 [Trichonephila clavipes]|nr:hypothetical protein TNCV_1876191 [Trichonephila clavipes]